MNSASDKNIKPDNSHEYLCVDKLSLYKALLNSDLSLIELPEMANKICHLTEIEIPGNVFPKLDDNNWFLQQFKIECNKNNIKHISILLNDVENITNIDTSPRNREVQKQFKWIKIAGFLSNCLIKVIIPASDIDDEKQLAAVDGLLKLSDFAELFSVDVVVEISNADNDKENLLNKILKAVNKPNCYSSIIRKQRNKNNKKTASKDTRNTIKHEHLSCNDYLERFAKNKKSITKNHN